MELMFPVEWTLLDSLPSCFLSFGWQCGGACGEKTEKLSGDLRKRGHLLLLNSALKIYCTNIGLWFHHSRHCEAKYSCWWVSVTSDHCPASQQCLEISVCLTFLWTPSVLSQCVCSVYQKYSFKLYLCVILCSCVTYCEVPSRYISLKRSLCS